MTDGTSESAELMTGSGDYDQGRRVSLKRLLPLGVIAVVAIFGVIFLRDVLTFETLAENRQKLIEWRDAHYLLTVLGFMAVYILSVAFSLPGATVLTLIGGFLFGLFPGVLIVVAAATIGAIAIFSAAKLGLGDMLQARLDASSGVFTRIRDGIKENEVSFMFLMRLVPAFPFFAANLVPALVGASLRNFAFTTFFGIIPGTLAITWIGSGLGEVFARGERPSLDIIWEWYVIGPILALSALAALPIALRYLRKGAK